MAVKPARPTRFLTIAEVADLLGVCTRTVRRRIDEGVLRAHRSGRLIRISEEDYAAHAASLRR
jgi:excisionase family DNA binding protein